MIFQKNVGWFLLWFFSFAFEFSITLFVFQQMFQQCLIIIVQMLCMEIHLLMLDFGVREIIIKKFFKILFFYRLCCKRRIWQVHHKRFFKKNINILTIIIRLQPLSFPGTDVFLILFSVASRTSFERVKSKHFPFVKHHCPKAKLMVC